MLDYSGMPLILLMILGLCLGSFVNALVWRIREQDKRQKSKKKSLKSGEDLSILHGRSMCPHCKHELAAKDLIPVLSWVELRGKCRYCKHSISWQYPLVEMSTAGLFIALYLLWPHTIQSFADWLDFGTWLALGVGFMALIVYDLRWMELPNRIVFPLIGASLANLLVQLVLQEDAGIIIGAVGGFLSVGGLFYLLFQFSEGKLIGGGDVKLGFVLGIIVGGWAEGLLVLFTSSLLGVVFVLPLLILHKKGLKNRIPFGPFLILAAIIVKLVGASIILWYKDLLLL